MFLGQSLGTELLAKSFSVVAPRTTTPLNATHHPKALRNPKTGATHPAARILNGAKPSETVRTAGGNGSLLQTRCSSFLAVLVNISDYMLSYAACLSAQSGSNVGPLLVRCKLSTKRCRTVVAAAQITAMDGGITVAIGSGRRQVLAGLREAH